MEKICQYSPCSKTFITDKAKRKFCSRECSTNDKRIYTSKQKKSGAAVTRRRQKIKELAVEYKGGKCAICGYNKCMAALQFHHVNPNEKDFSISVDGNCRSWEKVKEELDKCILLCANCHAEQHAILYKLSSSLIGKAQNC